MQSFSCDTALVRAICRRAAARRGCPRGGSAPAPSFGAAPGGRVGPWWPLAVRSGHVPVLLSGLIWRKFCCSVHSENFHRAQGQCSQGNYHYLEILLLCPQREFPSLNLSSPRLLIGQKSFPPLSGKSSETCQQSIVPRIFLGSPRY